MNLNDHYLLMFDSGNHTILFYTILENAGIDYFQLVSAPWGLKTGCSFAIKIPNKNYLPVVKRELERVNFSRPRLFLIAKVEGKTKYKEVLL